MNPWLEPGDRVVVDRLAYGLQLPLVGLRIGGRDPGRGDPVALLDPDGSGNLLVRRVFAVAGDRVGFTTLAPPTGDASATAAPAGSQDATGPPVPLRLPLLGRGGALPMPTAWAPWAGPCVYALEVAKRRGGGNYARCLAFQEINDGASYVVSYPRQPAGHSPWVGRIPKGKIYLRADNRAAGRDSRHWGPVSLRRIRGRHRVVLWSTDPLEGIRWHRMLRRLGFGR